MGLPACVIVMATEDSAVTTGPTGMHVKLHGDVGMFNVRLPGHLLRAFVIAMFCLTCAKTKSRCDVPQS